MQAESRRWGWGQESCWAGMLPSALPGLRLQNPDEPSEPGLCGQRAQGSPLRMLPARGVLSTRAVSPDQITEVSERTTNPALPLCGQETVAQAGAVPCLRRQRDRVTSEPRTKPGESEICLRPQLILSQELAPSTPNSKHLPILSILL